MKNLMSRVTFAFDNRHFYRDPKKTVMDYKYIEQLLERYWNAETTLEEENILRTFFCQKDIPAEMEPLRPLFTAETEDSLDDDFDARILAMIDEKPQTEKARRVTLTQRLMPLFKAASMLYAMMGFPMNGFMFFRGIRLLPPRAGIIHNAFIVPCSFSPFR